MGTPSLVILYVQDPDASVRFYANLLDRAPAVQSPNFAAIPLDGGFTLGLWANRKVDPPTAHGGSRSELAFLVPDPDAVDRTHRDWVAKGIAIAQEPVTLDFGRTFVGLDPDGHWLRVCLPDA
jgi:catechol 2,3-dioxygenase-like lactoylglutathione lyase family enzyme